MNLDFIYKRLEEYKTPIRRKTEEKLRERDLIKIVQYIPSQT